MILTTAPIVAQVKAVDPFTERTTPFSLSHVDETAKTWLISLRGGEIWDPTQLDAQERAIFTPAHAAVFRKELLPLGDPVDFTRVLTQSAHGETAYAYHVAFKNGTTTLFVMVVKGDKIAGLAFQRAPDEPHIRAWYDALAKGALLDENELTEAAKRGMTAATLFQVRSNLEANGVPTAFVLYDVRTAQDGTSFTYKVSYASAPPLLFTFSSDAKGKVDGLWFKPAGE